ncbi:MAG: SMC-Scp complex subunit ScpB, partial [Mesorhizobium sp.]
MSERANASVIPFKVEDDAEQGAVAENPAQNQGQNLSQNPGERLHMAEAVRMAEAIVFASAEPVSEKQLTSRLPDGINISAAMAELQQIYARRGVNLVRVGDAWAFRTAGDLAFLMSRDT